MFDDQFERQFFSYVVDVNVAGNAVQTPVQLQILSDADFEWWWSMVFRTSGSLKLLMKEQGTGRDFIGTTASGTGSTFNGVNIDLWAGTAVANAAFPLAVPYVMPATRVYSFLLTDSSGETNVVEIVLNGFKLWPRPESTQSAQSSMQPTSSSGQ
jgi:hypothetical protein